VASVPGLLHRSSMTQRRTARVLGFPERVYGATNRLVWSCECGAAMESDGWHNDSTCRACGRRYRVRSVGTRIWKTSLLTNPAQQVHPGRKVGKDNL
jgi:hypothetical protein